MSFRLVSKSVTLNDLQRRNGRYFALFQRIRVASRAHCVKVHLRYLISWWVLVLHGVPFNPVEKNNRTTSNMKTALHVCALTSACHAVRIRKYRLISLTTIASQTSVAYPEFHFGGINSTAWWSRRLSYYIFRWLSCPFDVQFMAMWGYKSLLCPLGYAQLTDIARRPIITRNSVVAEDALRVIWNLVNCCTTVRTTPRPIIFQKLLLSLCTSMSLRLINFEIS